MIAYKRILKSIYLHITLFLLPACFVFPAGFPGYDLSSPDALIVLSPFLHEISGIAAVGNNTIACVQDEDGIVFLYDISAHAITGMQKFGQAGDYEGIAWTGNAMYVLRSDGVLFEVSDFDNEKAGIITFVTGIQSDNNEGLCYDRKNNRLLVAAKNSIRNSAGYINKRVVYGFNLAVKKLASEPVIVIDPGSVTRYISGKGKESGGKKVIKDGIKLGISEIAIHPVTGKLFMLSASDHLLLIYDFRNGLEHIEELDSSLFNKPEGITFFENGDMLISNEGQRKNPTLLVFHFRK